MWAWRRTIIGGAALINMAGERRKEPSLKELVNLPIVSWYEVGLRLGVKQFELKRIQSNNAGQPDFHVRCCSDMFQMWLDNHPNPTYEDVHTALINCREKEAARDVNARVEQIPSRGPRRPISCVIATTVAVLFAASVIGIAAKVLDNILSGTSSTSVEGTVGDLDLPSNALMTAGVMPARPPNFEKHVQGAGIKRSTEDELIMTPGATGPEVVEACIRKMADSEILGLPDDSELL